MVGWKCQGASRWVPLWVESCTCSTAQPWPSGKSSAFNPGKNCSMRGSPCWWSIYWMAGWPPGGSAGTSFCSGTEMSISLRAMASPSCSPGERSDPGIPYANGPGGAALARAMQLRDVLPLDPVLQDADPLDFELDGVAVFEVPAELEATAIADGAGADELPRHQGFVFGDVLDNLLEREQHAFGNPLRAHGAVDPHFHIQMVRIADLVRGNDPGPHHVAAIETLALGGTEAALHFDALGVARGKIVEDRVAEDVVFGFYRRDIGALVLRDDAEFQLVIHHLAVARPLYRGVGAAHAEPVGDVVDRLLAIDLGQFGKRLGIEPLQLRDVVFRARCEFQLAARRLPDVQRKRHAVAHLPRLGNRRE